MIQLYFLKETTILFLIKHDGFRVLVCHLGHMSQEHLFFVMMPRKSPGESKIEKKGQPCNIDSHISLIPRALPHLGTERDHISSYPCRWVGPAESSGQWHVGGGEWYPLSHLHISSLIWWFQTEGPVKDSEVTEDESGAIRFKDLDPGMTVWYRAHTCCNSHWMWVTWEKKSTFIVFGHWYYRLAYYCSKPMMTNIYSPNFKNIIS